MRNQQNINVLLPKAVFWDMDGTLIDSEPYWHASEVEVALKHGGHWSEEEGWQYSGLPVIQVATAICERCQGVTCEQVEQEIIEGVARREQEKMPWIPGATELLQSLRKDGVPSILVTSSPRYIAQVAVDQAPRGVFAGFVCGDDGLPMKPDPAPYLYAAQLLGLSVEDMPSCVALEDSVTGLTAAVASGATTLAYTGSSPTGTVNGPQFASFNSYREMSAEALGKFVAQKAASEFLDTDYDR